MRIYDILLYTPLGKKKGELKAKITAYIPDSDCKDNYRKEVLSVSTDIKIK